MSMLCFKDVSFDDIDLIKKYVNYENAWISDYSVGIITMWKDVLNLQIAFSEDMVYLKSNMKGKKERFYIPFGSGDFKKAVENIKEYTKENNIELEFCSISFNHYIKLQNYLDGEYYYTPSRDYSDYVYSYNKLANLKGKKYHQKRNHISSFKRKYPDYKLVKIDEQNIDRVKAFFEEFVINVIPKDKSEITERECTRIALDNFSKLDFIGAFLEVEGNIVAFTIAEKKGDLLIVHVEKADRNYSGSYATINNEFLKSLSDLNIKWVNREDDSGEAGLRKAKLSYYPSFIAVKGSIKPVKV